MSKTIKNVVGKRQGTNQFAAVIYKCPAPCNQLIMANGYGESACPKCNTTVNVIPPKNERL